MLQRKYEYARKCFACGEAMHDMQCAFHFQDGSEYCSDRCSKDHLGPRYVKEECLPELEECE